MSATAKFPELIEGDWSSICKNEWELLTGVLLDARTPVERLRSVLLNLRKQKLLDFRALEPLSLPRKKKILKDAGYPWWSQKALCFHQSIPKFDLKNATLDQIQTIYGIGPKLGNLWMRFMNPEMENEFCVIDTHVRRYIRNVLGIDDSKHSYEELTVILRQHAWAQGLTISELDQKIVETGIGARLARRKVTKIKEVKSKKLPALPVHRAYSTDDIGPNLSDIMLARYKPDEK